MWDTFSLVTVSLVSSVGHDHRINVFGIKVGYRLFIKVRYCL
jgi:hypothetical protein